MSKEVGFVTGKRPFPLSPNQEEELGKRGLDVGVLAQHEQIAEQYRLQEPASCPGPLEGFHRVGWRARAPGNHGS